MLLVNPIRDGLNLVAKEGALVNDRDAVLVLSPRPARGSDSARRPWRCHPFDVAGTAEVLHQALTMPADERPAAGRAPARARRGARTPATGSTTSSPR